MTTDAQTYDGDDTSDNGPEALADAHYSALADLAVMARRLSAAIEVAADPARLNWGHVGTLRAALVDLESATRHVEACR